MRPGSPSPLGATLRADDGSVNFALFSQHAEGVTLCLYEPGEAEPDVRTVGPGRDACQPTVIVEGQGGRGVHAEGVTLCLFEAESAEPDVRRVGTGRDACMTDVDAVQCSQDR